MRRTRSRSILFAATATALALAACGPISPAPDRYRQDADFTISILDLTRMANVFTQYVSACP